MGEKKEDGEGVPFYPLLASEMHQGDQNFARKKALVVSSMAGGQKVIVSQIDDELGHERVWNLGEKKENDEGVPFHLLLTPGIAGEKAPVVSSMASGQKVPVSQIADYLEHERDWNLEEKKEDDE